ncbi:MAG TPA: ABC-F family ATP-binding cassette domain-containing protein [Thermoanaerobaculia bacterium]|jgi:ATP-binding cassette subfamily F protein uup|nr:ABC-F family ATP-binding cassette domain-containing protein [Thermoanaerobaculia bacterium]
MPPAVLLSCESIGKGYGARPLFENLSFGLFEGDRVGLVGPNGSGKTTLLRILAGIEEPDAGIRALRRGTRFGYVPQDPSFPPGRTPEEVLAEALADDAAEDFEKAARIAVTLGKAGFESPSQPVDVLSGGWKKRLAIARELVKAPDVLLMDEPTNHLDVEGILWLEGLLRGEPLAYLVVSHDRWFLENVANRVLELDRRYPDGLFQAAGSYSDFLEKRDEVLRNQAEYQASLANRVRREVEWLKRGAKARTTKAKGRIQEAERLIAELGELKERTGPAASARAGIDFNASDRKTKKLLVARGLTKSFDGRRIFAGLDLKLTPGTKLGLLGPNGSGKTTVLSLLDGSLEPDAGTIDRAAWLKTVRFEQGRETLDRSVSLRRALAPEGDSVVYQGRPVHVASWAKRFLFRSEQLDTPVSRLSGGEQARILIARLMLQPADLLLLDEPTNDLDIPTLEVLEESLLEFPGAVVLVTHDRYLLESVSTYILALDGRGNAEYFADYPQWEARRAERQPSPKPAAPKPLAAPREVKPTKRLSYKENLEWEQMEARILAAEEALAAAQQAVEDPAVASDAAELHARCATLEEARREVERLYSRWAELEEKRGG